MNSPDLLNELRIQRRSPAPPTRWPLWAAAAALALAIAALAWWLAGRDAPTPVTVATARAPASGPTAASVLDASGYVVARRQATVSAKITGKVAEVLIEEGMRVQQGQLMARLDDTDARAQLELSRAQLEAARSQLGEIQANLSLAERDLARQRELLGRALVSQSALDTAQAQRDALAARLNTARSQVAVAGDALRIARNGVDNTVIRAPFDGIVVAKAAQPGEMISPISAGGGFTRTGIGTVVDMDSLEIQVDVAEAYIGRVQPGQPVEAVLNAYPDWQIPASVIAIIPTADRSKATVKVRIALESGDPRIVPEMGVRVSFLGEPGAPAAQAPVRGVMVPADAVVDGTVYVVHAGVVERRVVETGATQADLRLVLSGLAAGEQVVIAPPAALRDGDTVAVQ